MLGLYRVFFQKKSIGQLVSEKPGIKNSLFLYIISLGVVLVGSTIGIVFEQLLFLLLGWTDLTGVFFSATTNFVAQVLIAIPGIIALSLLVLVYFFFAKILGANALDFPQFLSNFFVVAASVGYFFGIISVIPFLHHLINFFVVLYGVFLYIKLIKEYFSLSFPKAIIVWLIPTALLSVIVGLFLLLGIGTFFFLPLF